MRRPHVLVGALFLAACSSSAGPNGAPCESGGAASGSSSGAASGSSGGSGSSSGGSSGADAAATSVPTDGQGVTALRIADLMEIFGANVYSNKSRTARRARR